MKIYIVAKVDPDSYDIKKVFSNKNQAIEYSKNIENDDYRLNWKLFESMDFPEGTETIYISKYKFNLEGLEGDFEDMITVDEYEVEKENKS